jgi:sulfur-carrier protein adenylyltransferase/sulfurtransferase
MDPSNEVPEITVSELKQRLDRGDPVTIVDVREPYEWGISNLGEYGARLIPMRELADRLHEIDPAQEIVLQCRSGNRSAHAVQFLRSRGYPRVANLQGGILAWSDEIDSSKKKY